MRLGVIGTSWITEAFAEAAKTTGGYEITSVYSRDIERAKEFGGKYGAEFFYDDISAFAGSEIDVAYIASPNSLHVPQAKLLLQEGKHVICEKPLSKSYSEMGELFGLAERNGVFLFEALRHLHTEGFYKLQEEIDKIGAIRSCYLSFNQYSTRYPAFLSGETPNVFNPDMDGGALLDIGVYPVALAAALFGEPLKITGTILPLSNSIDGTGAAILKYDGFIVVIAYSKICQDHIQNQFAGENGTIVINAASEISEICLYGSRLDAGGSNGLIENQKIIFPQYAKFCQKMVPEAAAFASIIKNHDLVRYGICKRISLITCRIMEGIRQSGL